MKNNIVVGIPRIRKTIGTGGHIEELDKEQKVSFEGQKEISLSGGELQSSYDTFIRQSVNPYEVSRSQNILKTTIRSWCRNELNIGDEEKIQKIVLAKQGNNTRFKQVIEEAKEQYGNLPTKQDERITNDNWVIPKEVNLFSNIEKVIPSRKSILKQEDENCLLVRRDKNGVSELSKPEKEFIENLEKTDDYVQWWFKNGKSDAKYFSITYKKGDGCLYGFYPDFIVKTKKEIIIVEITDDKDFKADNYYKLLSGKN